MQTWHCGSAAKAGSGSKLAAFMVSKCIKPSTVETSLKTRVWWRCKWWKIWKNSMWYYEAPWPPKAHEGGNQRTSKAGMRTIKLEERARSSATCSQTTLELNAQVKRKHIAFATIVIIRPTMICATVDWSWSSHDNLSYWWMIVNRLACICVCVSVCSGVQIAGICGSSSHPFCCSS